MNAETVEDQVKSILAIPENLKIAFTSRLGYPETKPASISRVRRNIADFVHQNKW